MAVVDAATATQRWQAAAGTAQQRYQDGVNGYQGNPGDVAAARAQAMLNGVTAAVTSGYWQRRVVEGGQTWKSNTIAKAANYSNGIQQSGSKFQTGYTNFWNYATPILNQVLSMPKNTLADSVARATAWIQGAAAYQKP